jgi:capsular exopolysaccharide synthesis family protein
MIRLTTPLIPFSNRTSDTSDRASGQLERYFDALATQLVGQHATSVDQSRSIGITSCSAGEGVSTVARNLAITFAQTRGQSTLLIDTSGDGTDLTDIFGNREPRTNDANAEHSLRDCICRTNVENLSVLSASNASLRRPSIEPQEFHRLLVELKEDFERIVVDMPHADEFGDCFVMASALDGVTLVVEPEAISAADANHAKSRLQQSGARLLGVVINKEK